MNVRIEMTDINEAVRKAALHLDAALAFTRKISDGERVRVSAEELGLVLDALASTWPPMCPTCDGYGQVGTVESNDVCPNPVHDLPSNPKEYPATRIAELEEALRPFARLADEVNGQDTDYVPCSMLCGDFNSARKVLEE